MIHTKKFKKKLLAGNISFFKQRNKTDLFLIKMSNLDRVPTVSDINTNASSPNGECRVIFDVLHGQNTSMLAGFIVTSSGRLVLRAHSGGKSSSL